MLGWRAASCVGFHECTIATCTCLRHTIVCIYCICMLHTHTHTLAPTLPEDAAEYDPQQVEEVLDQTASTGVYTHS